MNNQIIAQDGAKSMIIRQSPKNGETPKGGRPTNEYKLTGTPLPDMARGGVTPKLATLKAPERMNEEREGIFNQLNFEGVNH